MGVGRRKKKPGEDFDNYPFSDSESAKSRAGNVHFTMIFNVFVLMTLFNEINARLASTTFSIRQFIVEIAKSAI